MFLLLCFYAIYSVMTSYRTKLGMPIMVDFFPPRHFIRGPMNNDQGISF